VNVIVVTAQFPYPPRTGMTMRVYHLLQQLVRRHNVTLLSLVEPGQRDAAGELRKQLPVVAIERNQRSRFARRFDQLRSIVSLQPFSSREVYFPELQQALDRLCVTTSCDVVQIETCTLGCLSVPSGASVILDEHNIEYEVFHRMCESERSLIRRVYNRWECTRVRRFEEQCWTRVDGCVVTSEREDPLIRRVAPHIATAVVPNAVDLEYFSPSIDAVEPNSVVFNGTLGYRPNVDAAYHLVDEIWPLVRERCPDAQLTIVGRASEADRRRLAGPGVLVTGEVADVRPYLQRASVIVVPVSIGGGTRLKVVEGLAMGKAMVSTTLGCEGVAVRDGEHLLIGDGAAAFAARILDCFADPELRDRLGVAGRRLTEEDYSWELAGDRLDALYTRVTGGRGEASSGLVTAAAPR
jgi:glycosyltransferase involved in cell wall biosynthesis